MVSLPLLLMLLSSVDQPGGSGVVRPPVRYVTTVSFGDGKCRYFTGDAMFDTAGFSRDLRRRFDRRTGMTIFYSAGLPAQCVTEARGLVEKAGFKDVRLVVGRVDPFLP